MERFTLPLLSLFLLFAVACNGSPQQDQVENDQYGYTGQDQANPAQQGPGAPATTTTIGDEKLTRHAITDQNLGMVSEWMPLPSSWHIEQAGRPDGLTITGPGGVKVYNKPGGTYNYSNDPSMQQVYQMAGTPMRPPIAIETYIQQDLSPYMAKSGMRLVKQYPLPEIAAKNEAYMAQLFKVAPSRDLHSSMGTDWMNEKGEPVFVIVNMLTSWSQTGSFWTAYIQMLQAEPASMEQAKAALINGIVNTENNPQFIAAHNADQQQKSNQNWAQHNAQMQQNQQNFDQGQATHRRGVEQWQASTRSANEAVHNSIMGSYNSRMQANDEIQRMESNYLNDENTVRDKSTGERYQVQSGADQYWMNNNNEYIKSNDALYNPNLDQNVWDQQWQETEKEP